MQKQTSNEKFQYQELVGPQAFGPRKCIDCGQSFQANERWIRFTSLSDSVWGNV